LQKIGWKKLGTSRRLVVFVTDAQFHAAGDGKVGTTCLEYNLVKHLNLNSDTFIKHTIELL